MNKILCLNLMSTFLATLAIFATILGGVVLAFDKSLWPLDGQVLYIGHISHVLVIPTSMVACRRSTRAYKHMQCTRGTNGGHFGGQQHHTRARRFQVHRPAERALVGDRVSDRHSGLN